jgi:hypothetical protein
VARSEQILAWAARTPVAPLSPSEVPGPNWFDYHAVYDRAVFEAREGAVFVVVGAWFGRCVLYLAQALQRSGKRVGLYAVDTWTGVPNDPEQDGSYAPVSAQFGDPYQQFLATLAAGGVIDRVKWHRLPSVEAAHHFADCSCDFVFIDADHSQPAVRADLAAWMPKVRAGGVLAGHDYNLPGVRAAVDAVIEENGTVRGDRITLCGSPNNPCWLVRR